MSNTADPATTKEDEVFLDTEEEVTPRRSGRKRRSIAGNTPQPASSKKLKSTKKMPVGRSPDGAKKTPGSLDPDPKQSGVQGDEAFWNKMGGLLGGMEKRLKDETMEVRDQLGQAIGDLGSRVEKTETRLDGIVEEVNHMVDARLARSMGSLGQGVTYPMLEPGAVDGEGQSGISAVSSLSACVGESEGRSGSGGGGDKSYVAALMKTGESLSRKMAQPKRSARSKE